MIYTQESMLIISLALPVTALSAYTDQFCPSVFHSCHVITACFVCSFKHFNAIIAGGSIYGAMRHIGIARILERGGGWGCSPPRKELRKLDISVNNDFE